ncbi:AAA family ATPase [Brachybacterium sp. p3-SID1565]|uniref:AAA family ATPase n=1 Tax=Brachybacterium epidermidis TaxID=2781983 RepID=A0ABR9VYU2_9MICO|nr:MULTISPECIES: AAA family ATPase [Brachybacterium]MBE9403354.1 AAA family ATPase [Brachybacterium epidermidis]MCT1384548.1 AAA family ATPase [Brachybacterium sp. p3-SID1565]
MTRNDAQATPLSPDLTQLLHTLNEVVELAQQADRRPQTERMSVVVPAHLGETWTAAPEETFRFAAVRADEVWAAVSALLDLEGDDAAVWGLGDENGGGLSSLRSLVHADFTYPSFPLTGPTYTTLTFPGGSVVRTPIVAVALAMRDGAPQAILFSAAQDQERGILTVLGDGADATLAAVREAMAASSLLSGQVVELHLDFDDIHGTHSALTLLPRPEVTTDQIVLPEGLLERVTDHVHGIHDAASTLREAGQHLRRGVLLYGPPGTGKTLMIRHLMSRPDVTAVVLRTLENGQMRAAMELARSAQPALLVVEDTDLLLGEGPHGFEMHALLEELDGLGADADIAVVLSTNDPAALLPSLNHRPGRIDLQVEVPLPDVEAREKLFALYGAPLDLPSADLLAAAEATDGASGAWIREVVRREVLAAARDHRDPSGAGLLECIAGMRRDDEAVLSSVRGAADHLDDDADEDGFDEGEGYR